MLIGQGVWIPVSPSQVVVFLLVTLSSHGNLRSNKLFHVLLLNPNIGPWPQPVVNLCGFVPCLRICWFLIHRPPSYIVIVK
jgi:hypothetical protein